MNFNFNMRYLFLITVLLSLSTTFLGTKIFAETVNQSSRQSREIKKNILPLIKLPPGFKIEVFALAPKARHMTVSKKDGIVWIGTRYENVWQAKDTNLDNKVEVVERFAPNVDFDIPNGVCFSAEGSLYVAERNRVLMFPNAKDFMKSSRNTHIAIIKQGSLIPVNEESNGHTARVCEIGPDDKLYVSLGQPYNVAPPSKIKKYEQYGIGGIIRFNRFPGKLDREVVAIGIRNSVGHAFNPKDDSLWFTDNQVDGMGDDIPPGEINKAPRLGPNVWYGHPFYGGGDVRTYDYQGKQIPDYLKNNYVRPQVETIAHAADLGMMFYQGQQFPSKYHNAIFSAQHGSWNSTKPRGPQVIVTFLDAKGNAAKTEVFADGWMDQNKRYLGRPVDVKEYVDGSILVSDDKAGVVYRIYYTGK